MFNSYAVLVEHCPYLPGTFFLLPFLVCSTLAFTACLHIYTTSYSTITIININITYALTLRLDTPDEAHELHPRADRQPELLQVVLP